MPKRLKHIKTFKAKIKSAKLAGKQQQSRHSEATQENHLSKATLGYIVSRRPAWVIRKTRNEVGKRGKKKAWRREEGGGSKEEGGRDPASRRRERGGGGRGTGGSNDRREEVRLQRWGH